MLQALDFVKKYATIILLVFCTPCVWGDFTKIKSINLESIIGNWTTPQEQIDPVRPQHTLKIDRAHNVLFHRDPGTDLGGSIWKKTTTTEYVELVSDVLIITFMNEQEISFRLTLSGWSLDSKKVLFGQILIYYKGNVINGLPITLEASPEI